MAGASADGELNHWPAFVDVLTTVIMVVTFLLVIMSAAVMVLSQRAMDHFKKELLFKEQAKIEKTKEHDAEAKVSAANAAPVLRAENPIDGSDPIAIDSVATKDQLKIQVKAVQDPTARTGVAVKTADVFIRVDFDAAVVSYDADNAAKISAFLKAKTQPGMKFEIWSFEPQTSSESEAQRVAFYRAAMTRNILIKAGIAPADIQTQIKITDPASTDGHNVRVVLKP